jgi:aminomethyltransferase
VQETLRRTPLHDRHVALGARMVPFAGWEMPVQYEGVIQEHRAVREDAGAFDVSHMGEIEVEGPQRASCSSRCSRTTSSAWSPGGAQYTLLTNEQRRDRRRPDRLRARPVPLPADRERLEPRGGYAWLKEREVRGSDVRDVSDEYGLIAVQGPTRSSASACRRRRPGVHDRRGRGRAASPAWSTAPATPRGRGSSCW